MAPYPNGHFDMVADAELDSLLNTLESSIKIFRTEAAECGLPPPSARYSHPLDTSGLPSPKLFEAKRTILATLGVLKSTFQSPFERLTEITHAGTLTASLQVIARTGVVDALHKCENPERGLSLTELQKVLDVDARKLAAPMRLLSTIGWFEETEEARFKNTKMEQVLRKDSSAFYFGYHADLYLRNACGLAEAVVKPEWKYSMSPLHTGCQIGNNTDKHLFELVHSNPDMLHSFTHAIHALEASVLDSIVADYPWNDLEPGTTVVDVGGGRGGMTVALAKSLPSLKFVVQDRPGTVKFTAANMSESLPEAFQQGRIRAMPHDFFTEQPLKGDGYVYTLKWVIHDWPEQQSIEILSQIAKAAGPKSRILVIDNIVTPVHTASTSTQNGSATPASSSSDEEEQSVIVKELEALSGKKTYTPIAPPPFVPANFGVSSLFPLQLGVSMEAALNACERTLSEFQKIFDGAGLKLRKVHHLRSWVSIMELEVGEPQVVASTVAEDVKPTAA
ncbi:S-adenosyl-L-methionine-dependent methyltransferase [Sistotremastrum suecicum HHB10207 ss-3]|uniref:S-adenosyl-L-methionine-dependent methyltransferase n=1 Tax=Sistotremastrum suecicum HHB10207 ss-3 TaxID=1314776 RepID=A0A166H432_9AGAM|nr:S-adenosyl-L-methionine-dependent methyltransferase [Sistotremastrum suecicum HHB10207 ss-3]